MRQWKIILWWDLGVIITRYFVAPIGEEKKAADQIAREECEDSPLGKSINWHAMTIGAFPAMVMAGRGPT
jgi:hypothetical protein